MSEIKTVRRIYRDAGQSEKALIDSEFGGGYNILDILRLKEKCFISELIIQGANI